MMRKRAVILLSGGIDSATTLFIAKKKGYECRPLIFDYGQRHRRELDSAKGISNAAGCKYILLKINLPWKGSALLDKDKRLPRKRSLKEMLKCIPSSYVPARNIIFLSLALSYAETIKADKIFIGANSIDFSGYPDCREPFFKAFEDVIKEGTKSGVEKKRISIEAPLLFKTKGEIVNRGMRLGVPYKDTWSCYEGNAKPCGICDSCILRKKGFDEAGVKDPLL